MQLTDLNIGVLFILAVSSMGVYGIALAGWASNNKYALLGGLRSSAQMISYELPMSHRDRRAAADLEYPEPARAGGEAGGRHLALEPGRRPLPQVVSFIIFLIAAFAETNRVPFDLPEAENELVAGFHTEYSSMKFAVVLHGRVRQHDHGERHGDAAVPGRLGAPWPAQYGSSFVPALIFAVAGLVALYHGVNAGAEDATSSPSRRSASFS